MCKAIRKLPWSIKLLTSEIVLGLLFKLLLNSDCASTFKPFVAEPPVAAPPSCC